MGRPLGLLFRVSRSSDMSHDDFIDCLMDLRVDLKAEEILACYTYLQLDKHAHLKLDRPSHNLGEFQLNKNCVTRITKTRSTLENQKRLYLHDNTSMRTATSKCRTIVPQMNRASICKINELEGQLERLSRTGLTVDVFRNAMRKPENAFDCHHDQAKV